MLISLPKDQLNYSNSPVKQHWLMEILMLF